MCLVSEHIYWITFLELSVSSQDPQYLKVINHIICSKFYDYFSVVTNISSSVQDSSSVTLSWSRVITETGDVIGYQVGYSADTQCNGSIDTLPAGYTLFGNTTSNSIVVTGLEPDTCYVFGVSVHLEELEKWSVIVLRTLTLTGQWVLFKNDNAFLMLLICRGSWNVQ